MAFQLRFQCANEACPDVGQLRPLALAPDLLRQLRESGKTKVRLKCPRCGTPIVLPLPEEVPAGTPETQLPDELGQLISVDTGRTYPLRLGRNVVGKGSVSKPADVALEANDPHLSRQHCVVEVRIGPSGRVEYLLSDANATGDGPMSLNGTFVNDRPQPLQPPDRIFLRDGDTIRLGATRLRLRALPGTFGIPTPNRSPAYEPTRLL